MDVERFIAFSMQKLGYGREKKDQQEAINFKILFKFLGIDGINFNNSTTTVFASNLVSEEIPVRSDNGMVHTKYVAFTILIQCYMVKCKN